MRKNLTYFLSSVAFPLGRWAVMLLLAVAFPAQNCLAADPFDPSMLIFHFHGEDTTSRIGAYINSVGDINGDGFADIAISSKSPAGTYIFYGGDPPDSVPDLFIVGSNGTADPIDLDGDGIDDIVNSASYGDNIGAVYFYKGFGDSIGSVPYDSLFPQVDNFGFGWSARTGYVDSDFLGDLLIKQRNTPGGATLHFYSGAPTLDTIADWSYSITNYSHSIAAYGFIDFNGDGCLDVYAGLRADRDTLSYVYIFNGPDFGTTPDLIIGHPIEIEVADRYEREAFASWVANIGDVNGDGWEDLGVTYSARPLVYLAGPQADTVYDYWMGRRAVMMKGAGDINGDGYGDLLTGGVGSAYGLVDLYLGGPQFDTVFDLSIFRSDLPPLFLDRVGWRVSTAGDFNGDGYDDFIFSCENFAHGEPWDVFVVAGSRDITTGISGNGSAPLPDGFQLRQNYPNPFNPSTSIEFDLSQHSSVILTIHNALGQKVASLIDADLAAGSYSIEWDGQSDGGVGLATGVYFYRLTTDDFSATEKMVLLK